MKLDRPLQLIILETLRDAYPSEFSSEHILGFKNHESFMQNMFYLEEHGFVKVGAALRQDANGRPPVIIEASITAQGLDFLEADGGLTAIFNTVTVKLHPDDLCKLLASRIEKLNIPEKKRNTLASTIKSLPAETLKKVYLRLIVAGLDHAPDVYQLLQKYLEKPG